MKSKTPKQVKHTLIVKGGVYNRGKWIAGPGSHTEVEKDFVIGETGETINYGSTDKELDQQSRVWAFVKDFAIQLIIGLVVAILLIVIGLTA